METIMQVLSETRFYWLPVVAVLAAGGLAYAIGQVAGDARRDLFGTALEGLETRHPGGSALSD